MDTSDVCRSLFGQRTLKELTAQMLAIQNLRFYNDGKLGAVLFTQVCLRRRDSRKTISETSSIPRAELKEFSSEYPETALGGQTAL